MPIHRLNRSALAGLLALSLSGVMPALALADGMINLPPLQNTSVDPYNNTPYSNSSYNTINTYPNATNLYQSESVSLRGRVSAVPKGTMLMIKLDNPVSSATSHVGEEVTGTLENDIFINESIAIPAGSEIKGQVANVEPSGHMGRHGSVDLKFFSIRTPNGQDVSIRAHVVTSDQTGILKGDSYTKDVLKGVGIAVGGAGAGTLLGMSAGSLIGSTGAGALFGLSMGAVGGMSYALIRKGKDVTVPSGSRMSIQLDQNASVNL